MSIKKKTISGLFWSFGQQFTMLGLNLVVSVILARLMGPDQFGLIGMVAIFIAVGEAVVGGGLGASVIRTEQPDELDYATTFLSNMVIGITLYGMLYLAAPFIAEFFHQPILTTILRVYMLTIIVYALGGVQITRLTKEMDFKKLSIALIPSEVISGALGIYLAFKGYGVWSLVWMNLIQAALYAALLWIISGWAPVLQFSRVRFKKHFTFGANILASTLLERIFQNIYTVFISRFYPAAQVGYYTRSYTFVMIPVNNFYEALTKVAFPAFSSIQNDTDKLLLACRKLMQQALFLLLPLMMMMILVAVPLFQWMLTDKWLPAVPYFRLLCVVGMVVAGNGYFQNVLMVKGRSDLLLKVVVLEKVIITIGICCIYPFGVKGLLYYQIASSFILFVVNGYVAGTLVNYPLIKQLRDVGPLFAITALSAIPAYLFSRYLDTHTVMTMACPIRIILVCLVYSIVYLTGFLLFGLPQISDFRALVLGGITKKMKPWTVPA